MSMKKIVRSLVAVAGLVVAASAYAGIKGEYPVYVNATSRYIYGAISSTRNSADTTSYMYCTTYSYAGSTTPSAYCYARDAAGNYGGCSTTDAGLVDVVKSIESDSYLSISWDVNGACTYIYNYDYSPTPTKAH